MKYKGSCHCKLIIFEFESEDELSALQCNCSICRRKNALMSQQSYKSFKLLSGEGQLAVYHWGDNEVNHYFCKNCGIYPFHNTSMNSEEYRINLGCVDGLDLSKLKISYFDGKNQL